MSTVARKKFQPLPFENRTTKEEKKTEFRDQKLLKFEKRELRFRCHHSAAFPCMDATLQMQCFPSDYILTHFKEFHTDINGTRLIF